MNTYSLTTNRFQVDWGVTRMGFTEVSGLSIGIEPINYQEDDSKESAFQKMPGRVIYNNVILKRGIVFSDNEFYTWMNTIKLNNIERRDLTITLLDENLEPSMVWRLKNAFPIKIEWSPLRADANEAAIESIEVTHEGLTVQNV